MEDQHPEFEVLNESPGGIKARNKNAIHAFDRLERAPRRLCSTTLAGITTMDGGQHCNIPNLLLEKREVGHVILVLLFANVTPTIGNR
jgi:hypothetical protein